MKKFSKIALCLLIALSVSACQGKSNQENGSTEPITINSQEQEFVKTLSPVDYEEGEEYESLYYKTVMEEGDICYEVKPEGEDPLRVPVDQSVIYGIQEGDCSIEKVILKSDSEDIVQYRLNVLLEAGSEK